jgi:alpha-galactosidase
MAKRSCEGTPITLKDTIYERGVGTHAASEVTIDLKGVVTRFTAEVGLDAERAGKGSITFEVWSDGKRLAATKVLTGAEAPVPISVDLRGRKRLVLIATDAGDGVANDHADWADAAFTLAPGAKVRPQTVAFSSGPPPVIHSGFSPVPAIHGPRIVGATPGRPFLFRIPATGKAPLTFSASGLPAGLKLDAKSGIVSGALAKAGTYPVRLTVKGPRGRGQRTLRIVGGPNKLALTPPMGWNSWYVWYCAIDQEKMRHAAEWMVKSGLAAHGYQYVCIDDCWEGNRDAKGEIQPNERFPNMKRLGDYIHSQGLKFGIYTSPGPQTCAGYAGSYQHELQDVRTYASWGVDFLKHDWCSYQNVATGTGQERFVRPYRVMQDALAQVNRDMVYSLCQYGMGDVWKWGASVEGNLWRTTDDSGDLWSVVSKIGFAQDEPGRYARPGHWIDPDMIQVGWLGGPNLRPTRLNPHEQVTQMTLWSLLAAPIILSCELSKLDRFTLDLLTNDEFLDVNQDPLGKAATRRASQGQTQVWARRLWDGTIAVGLFNLGREQSRGTADWKALGITGRQPVRDLWRQMDLGPQSRSFSALVPAHGAIFVKIGRPSRTD